MTQAVDDALVNRKLREMMIRQVISEPQKKDYTAWEAKPLRCKQNGHTMMCVYLKPEEEVVWNRNRGGNR